MSRFDTPEPLTEEERLIAYFKRSAQERVIDPLAWQERYMRGVRIIAALHLPKIKPASNIRTLKRKSA